jgi:hypothetical protein
MGLFFIIKETEQDMNQGLKTMAFASLCFSLMLPINSFASQGAKGGGGSNAGGSNGGGGNGGGGKPTSSRILLGASSITTPSGFFPAVAETANVITVTAINHEGDAPKITMTSGPAGLIIYQLNSVDNPPNGNGFSVATYVWTPNRNEIGTPAAHATFVATTLSGESATLPIDFEPVQDIGPTFLSGFTATKVNDHIEAHWNPNESGDPDPLVYTLTACYKSVIPGTDALAIDCDPVDTTDSLSSLNIPLGPTINVGNPSVPATYYGLFVYARKSASGLLVGQASVNLQ